MAVGVMVIGAMILARTMILTRTMVLASLG
jgi:hypothetical protein